ncbi:MAG TPA: SPFH domain-containing protein [Treponemataceae bacterium]|nr:SPFH domain-containing protein [Treponemataceae bacterium]HPS43627.1 SPFH domain-containing protein [Treponemataceae bacterium]
MKKMFASLIVLALVGGAIFFAGWVQFWVPAGKYGVMVSKTGGVNTHPIEPAQFRWQWERLLPTNAKLLTFDLAPTSRVVSASGSLPSAEIYGPMLEGKPDFSWKLDFAITARIAPTALPGLVKSGTVSDQASLAKFADAQVEQIANDAAKALIADMARDPTSFRDIANDRAELAKRVQEIAAKRGTAGIELIAVSVTGAKLPDFALYDLASKTYASYQERRTTLMAETTKAEARNAVADYLEIERFSALGEVLTKYPILIDYLAVTREGSLEAFKALKSRP